MDKDLKVFLPIFISLCIAFLSYGIFSAMQSRKENMTYNFHGVVEKVNYDEKGIPSVMVNGIKYYLSPGYNFDHRIETGDTLTKEKASNIYRLKKSKTSETLEFRN